MKGIPLRILLIGAGVGIVLLLPFAARSPADNGHGAKTSKRFSRELAADVSLRRHGVYGVDFVLCGSCWIEKLKHGPFTFGGLNVLVLKDLAV